MEINNMGIRKLNKFLLNFDDNLVKVHASLKDFLIAHDFYVDFNSLLNDRETTFNIKSVKYPKPCAIAIDAFLYMFKYKYSYHDANFLQGFYNQIIRFLSNRIIPIYVFEGEPPTEKKKTLQYREKKRDKIKNKIKYWENEKNNNRQSSAICDENIDRLKKQIVNISHQDIELLQDMLTLMNVPFLTSRGEADFMCAQLSVSNKIDACLSDDMDILVCGCKKLIKLHHGTIYEYDLDKILTTLNINYSQFIDMCILFGCDYTIPIPKLHPETIYHLITHYKTLEKVIEFFNNDKINPILSQYLSARKIFTDSKKDEDIPLKDIEFFRIDKKIDIKNLNQFLQLQKVNIPSSRVWFNFKYINKIIDNKLFLSN